MTLQKYESKSALFVQGLSVCEYQSIWYQRLQPGKVTLQSVSSFKVFMGLKTMGLASGKKNLLEQGSCQQKAGKWLCDEPAMSAPGAGRGGRVEQHLSGLSLLQLVILAFICSKLASK